MTDGACEPVALRVASVRIADSLYLTMSGGMECTPSVRHGIQPWFASINLRPHGEKVVQTSK
jgi:hypothetical protein